MTYPEPFSFRPEKYYRSKIMKIGVIGGGLTGLVAAHALAPEHEVDLFEKMPYLGGCLSSYKIDDYWIERFYHHCFSDDHHLFYLLDKIGLSDKLEWKTGTTGYFANGTVYPLNTPLQILKYPELSLIDKARLALLTFHAKKIDPLTLDDVPANLYIINNFGKNIYSSFFEPLLKSKFGEHRNEVSAAWLISRIAIRSNRGIAGERLGYLKGGFHSLIDTLERSIELKAGHVYKHYKVEGIRRRVEGWEIDGTYYDSIISTIPPQELMGLGGPGIPPVPYQGAACMTLGMKREVTRGVYWLNMKDPAPYGAVVTHTNFIPSERYGEHIVYLASYFSGTCPSNLDTKMIDDFCSRFSVARKEISWHRMALDPWAGPIFRTGYRSLIPSYEQHGLFMAGMFSMPNYPERSMEGSIRAGYDVVNCINLRSPT